jgi:hypothetical protein
MVGTWLNTLLMFGWLQQGQNMIVAEWKQKWIQFLASQVATVQLNPM